MLLITQLSKTMTDAIDELCMVVELNPESYFLPEDIDMEMSMILDRYNTTEEELLDWLDRRTIEEEEYVSSLLYRDPDTIHPDIRLMYGL